MPKYEVEFANLNLNWQFPHMLSKLPGPGTEYFDFLTKGLFPYQLSARSITIESPSPNLDDVALTIVLPKPELKLKITFSGIDIDVRNVDAEEVIDILSIIKVVFDCCEKIDSDTKKGLGTTKINLHLRLLDKKIEEYIAERASAKINDEHITPEAMVFSIDFDEITRHFPTRLTIAKSIAVENGLFLEINYQNGKAGEEFSTKEPITFFHQLADHYQKILSKLELEPS